MDKAFFVNYPTDIGSLELLQIMSLQPGVVNELVKTLSRSKITATQCKSGRELYPHIVIENFKPLHETILHMLVTEYGRFYVTEYHG
jgi:hypothetical protein